MCFTHLHNAVQLNARQLPSRAKLNLGSEKWRRSYYKITVMYLLVRRKHQRGLHLSEKLLPVPSHSLAAGHVPSLVVHEHIEPLEIVFSAQSLMRSAQEYCKHTKKLRRQSQVDDLFPAAANT